MEQQNKQQDEEGLFDYSKKGEAPKKRFRLEKTPSEKVQKIMRFLG